MQIEVDAVPLSDADDLSADGGYAPFCDFEGEMTLHIIPSDLTSIWFK